MAIIRPIHDIYGNAYRLTNMLVLLMLAGMFLIGLIFWLASRNMMNLRKLELREQRVEDELGIAHDIQMGMLPSDFPSGEEYQALSIHAFLQSAREVGGDLYDYFLQDNILHFCIADGSGKGIPASLMMAVARSLFRTVAQEEDGPSRVLSSLNASIADMNDSNMFVTMFVGQLDLKTGLLRYSNAGHNPPVLLTEKGPSPLPVNPNLPLGLFADTGFGEQEVTLRSGEGLFIYTDGLTEAENPELALFGTARMMENLETALEPEDQIRAMTRAVEAFAAGATRSDDLTLLMFRYHPERLFHREIVLENRTDDLSELRGYVSGIADAASLDKAEGFRLNLVLEEVVANVVNYAYPDGERGTVRIVSNRDGKDLCFTVTDSGIPFDPTAAPEPDLTLPPEKRPVGGLGIHLVREYMDSVRYERKDDQNILTLRKKIWKQNS